MNSTANQATRSDRENNLPEHHFKLINGRFESQDAMEILTQITHVKIKFHENKILATSSEEDIKMRESRIRELQKTLMEIRQFVQKGGKSVFIDENLILK